jgi:hypothetical protein
LHDRFTDRFERGARSLAALNYPHICAVYDIGPDYLVREFIEGEPPAALTLGPTGIHCPIGTITLGA